MFRQLQKDLLSVKDPVAVANSTTGHFLKTAGGLCFSSPIFLRIVFKQKQK
jgi:hypothetical protein